MALHQYLVIISASFLVLAVWCFWQGFTAPKICHGYKDKMFGGVIGSFMMAVFFVTLAVLAK